MPLVLPIDSAAVLLVYVCYGTWGLLASPVFVTAFWWSRCKYHPASEYAASHLQSWGLTVGRNHLTPYTGCMVTWTCPSSQPPCQYFPWDIPLQFPLTNPLSVTIPGHWPNVRPLQYDSLFPITTGWIKHEAGGSLFIIHYHNPLKSSGCKVSY